LSNFITLFLSKYCAFRFVDPSASHVETALERKRNVKEDAYDGYWDEIQPSREEECCMWRYASQGH